ncbi:MAG: transporter substrate-binding domain-containing protein, partial [Eubacteriales bacterium]|nr:transporter substrate-binding domain-containing protein [Eubacteriales bacterium]
MTVSLGLAVNSYAANERSVRVAFFESAFFLEGASENAVKSGYAYEILHQISNIEGWKYEYVYGEWSELFEKFKRGEIDIFPGIAKRDDRAVYMNWSDLTIDEEYHSVFVKKGNSKFKNKDPKILNGMKVGLISGNNMSDEFLSYCEELGIEPVPVYVEDVNAMTPLLENGSIDAFMGSENNINNNLNFEVFVRVSETKSYIAVRKGADEILDELNDAMKRLIESYPDFYRNLKSKYYSTNVANTNLSEAGKEWVETHDRLVVGYFDSYLPFSGTDDEDNATGLVVDVMRMIGEALDITDRAPIEFVPYKTYNEMLRALEDGKIDAAFPVMKSVWHAESNNIMESEAVVRSSISAIYSGKFDSSKLNIIAVNRTSSMQEVFVRENYPDSTVLEFDTQKQCLDAVLSGLAGCTLYNSSRKYSALNGTYEVLEEMPLEKDLGMAVAVKKGNVGLMSIINQGLNAINKGELTSVEYKYLGENTTYSFKTLFRQNAIQIVLLLVIFFGLVTMVILVSYDKAKRAEMVAVESQRRTSRLNEELKKSHDELEKMMIAAENANKAKTDFLFSMSHDIRTPMNAIIGFTDLLEKNLEDKEKVTDYIKKIKTSNEYLLSLINNVLEMARIESGKVKLDEYVTNVKAFCDEMFLLFDSQMKGKDIKLKGHIDIDDKLVYMDSTKMRQVV